MAALDEVSRHILELLERQRIFIQNASHQLLQLAGAEQRDLFRRAPTRLLPLLDDALRRRQAGWPAR